MPAPIQYYPPYYQEWLFKALGLSAGEEAEPAMLEPLRRLSRQWVGGATSDKDYADDKGVMRAYAAYFMTINMPKLWFVLDRASAAVDRILEANAEVTIAEFGCGPGTFLWAFLFWLRERRPEALARVECVRGIDRSAVALDLAGRLGQGLVGQPEFGHLRLEFRRGDWLDHVGERSDFAVFGNVLNEGQSDPGEWASQLETSMPIIIEPGTAAAFRQVLPARDSLIANGWAVRFPCPTPHPCPMAQDNWCHFFVNRLTLPFIQRMSNVAGRLNPRHNFCAFAFDHGDAPSISCTWRVLSSLRKAHRSGIRYLCDGQDMFEAVLGRRDRAAGNRAFLEAEAGDALDLQSRRGREAFVADKHIRSDDLITPIEGGTIQDDKKQQGPQQ